MKSMKNSLIEFSPIRDDKGRVIQVDVTVNDYSRLFFERDKDKRLRITAYTDYSYSPIIVHEQKIWQLLWMIREVRRIFKRDDKQEKKKKEITRRKK